MSDSSQGPGWWQASDGKWYAPEQHPRTTTPSQAPFAPPPAATPFGSPADATEKPWWRRWWVIAIGVVLALVIVGGIVGNNQDDQAGEPDGSAPAVTQVDGAATDDDPAPVTSVATTADADQPPPPDAVETTAPTETTAPADTTPPGAAGTRDDPFRIGEPVAITLDALGDGDGSVWTIVVDGPGTDVTESVREESPFNEPPPDDSIFFGVPVSMTLESADKEPLSTLFNLELELYGAATASIIDQGFDEGCGLAPGAIDPLREVFVGGTVSGIVCLAVTEADIDAGVLLTTDSGEGDRIFFATSGEPFANPPAATDEPEPTASDPETEAGSRSNPFSIGEPATITLDALGDADGSVWTIGVNGAGSDITAAIIAENPFNEPPPDGSVYFGVPVSLTLDAANKEPLSMGFDLELEFFGPTTLSIIDWGVGAGCGTTPGALDPFKEVFVGGSVSGVLCLPVKRADIDADVLLTTDSGEGDRIYFATS